MATNLLFMPCFFLFRYRLGLLPQIEGSAVQGVYLFFPVSLRHGLHAAISKASILRFERVFPETGVMAGVSDSSAATASCLRLSAAASNASDSISAGSVVADNGATLAMVRGDSDNPVMH